MEFSEFFCSCYLSAPRNVFTTGSSNHCESFPFDHFRKAYIESIDCVLNKGFVGIQKSVSSFDYLIHLYPWRIQLIEYFMWCLFSPFVLRKRNSIRKTTTIIWPITTEKAQIKDHSSKFVIFFCPWTRMLIFWWYSMYQIYQIIMYVPSRGCTCWYFLICLQFVCCFDVT